MKYKVMRKQNNSQKCLVCGIDNPYSLNTRFYETDNSEVIAIFTPQELHQSYPQRTHGGIAAAILDETIGRAACIEEPGVWGVTAELNLKYKKPLPYGTPMKAVGRITRNTRKIFEGTGEILLENGEVAVSGWGKYMKMQATAITSQEFLDEQWILVEEEEQIDEIEIETPSD